ncbi:PAAR domain-containing protein [Chromobacterium piscinae]|uniref:PAAR domain-containing protein n=1 Tax=Chromobacterium piscinae TaxID=686831 RepID=UPI001E2A04BA|nr:PAAR domain-containing protein [Chromobacterium piscinae]MCD5327944.1 hypothetical protein [Chromobacterium piscinae]
MQHTTEEGQRLVADWLAKTAGRPILAIYPVATDASVTAWGGQVLATSPIVLGAHRIALVGDTVRYADGTEATIISGAGVAGIVDNRSIALVGSELNNGDRIAGPHHDDATITQYADEPPIEGLLDPAYVSASGSGV